jgi:hypothetical protein
VEAGILWLMECHRLKGPRTGVDVLKRNRSKDTIAMRKVAILSILLTLSACANERPSTQPASGEAPPPMSTEELQATLCRHLIEQLEKLLDAPVRVDAAVSERWDAVAVALDDDALAYQAVPGPTFVTELHDVADAARGIATVTDPNVETPTAAIDEAFATMEDEVQRLAEALPDDACVDHDRGAQSSLRNALAAALTAYVDEQSYDAVTPNDIGAIEPSLTFVGDEPAAVDAVSINLMAGDEIVMSILSETGRAFCIGHSSDETVYGTVDAKGATSLSDCLDSKPWPK